MEEENINLELQELFSYLILLTKDHADEILSIGTDDSQNIPKLTEQKIKNTSLLTKQVELLTSLHKQLQELSKGQSGDQIDGQSDISEEQRNELARRLVRLAKTQGR